MTYAASITTTTTSLNRIGLLFLGVSLSCATMIWGWSFDIFLLLTVFSVLTLVLFIFYLPPEYGSGTVKSFFAVLALFHFGLLPSFLFRDAGTSILPSQIFLTHEFLIRPAITSCLAFVTTFTIAVASNRLGTRNNTNNKTRPKKITRSDVVYRVSTSGLVIAIIIWAFLIYGIIRPRNYIDYILFFEGNPGFAAIMGMVHTSIAATFFLSSQNAGRLWPSFALFGVWALLAFPLGLRGEVLFPFALAIPVLMGQGRLRIHWSAMTAGAIVVSVLIAIVASSRVGASFGDALANASPLNALSELGGSLRPSYEVQKWLGMGDPLRWGSTYYAPFERTFLLFAPLAERIPAQDDIRLMNVLIMKRAGPYGFSIVAEAVINFGFAGALALGAVFGLIVSRSAAELARNTQNVWVVALLFGAFTHIRQSFVTAFGAVVIFFMIIFTVILVSALLRTSDE